MTRRHPTLIALGLACVAAGPPATGPSTTRPAPASVRVRVARTTERRFARLATDSTTVTQSAVGLDVYLQLAGLPDLTTAAGFGHWAVTAASDDRGTDVSPATLPNAAEEGSTAHDQAGKYKDIDRDASDDLKPGPDGFARQLFEVQLGIPDRHASTLRRLAGHLDLLLGGADHVARFDRPTRRVGQTLADDGMRSAGVTVTFDRPDPADGPARPSRVTFHFHGDAALIHDDMLDVVGPDGKSVVTSWDASGPASEAEHAHTYDLGRPLDDAMAVTVRVRIGQRAVEVPFDLRDVPLP